MPWRYALYVSPIGARWRVSVADDVSAAPERLCDVDDKQAAVCHARALAIEFGCLGDEVCIVEVA